VKSFLDREVDASHVPACKCFRVCVYVAVSMYVCMCVCLSCCALMSVESVVCKVCLSHAQIFKYRLIALFNCQSHRTQTIWIPPPQ